MARERPCSEVNREDIVRLIKKIQTGEYPAVKTVMTITDAARTTAEVAKVDIDQAEEALGGRR